MNTTVLFGSYWVTSYRDRYIYNFLLGDRAIIRAGSVSTIIPNQIQTPGWLLLATPQFKARLSLRHKPNFEGFVVSAAVVAVVVGSRLPDQT